MSAPNVFALAVFFAVLVSGLIAHTARQVLRSRPAAVMRARLAELGEVSDVPADDRPADAATLFHERNRRVKLWARLDDRLRYLEVVSGKNGLRLAALVVVAAAIAAVGIARIDVMPSWSLPVLLVVLPAFGVNWISRQLVERFRLAFLNVFPDALELMVRAVRAGVPTVRAIEIVADECAAPVSLEFRKIADSLRLGIELERILNESMHRLRVPEFSFFCVALLLQRETGGPLSDTLEGLSDIVRSRKDVRMKSRALTAESRLASRIIACVPPLVFGLLYTVNREYVQILLDTKPGHMIVVASGALLTFGLIVIQKIAKLDTHK